MKKLFLFVFLTLFSITMFGCKKVIINADYGYEFHFSVEEGEGELTAITPYGYEPPVWSCRRYSYVCDLGCGENSYFVSLMGGKRGSHEVIFTAIPKEGYKVKEWTFNGKVVKGNKTNTYTATVTDKDKYKGVITVKFEKIE